MANMPQWQTSRRQIRRNGKRLEDKYRYLKWYKYAAMENTLKWQMSRRQISHNGNDLKVRYWHPAMVNVLKTNTPQWQLPEGSVLASRNGKCVPNSRIGTRLVLTCFPYHTFALNGLLKTSKFHTPSSKKNSSSHR